MGQRREGSLVESRTSKGSKLLGECAGVGRKGGCRRLAQCKSLSLPGEV